MKKIIFLAVLFTIAIFLSCVEDDLTVSAINENNNEILSERKIENGRFVFSSKKSLEKTINELKNSDIKNVEKEFEKYYAQGFRSNTPIVSPDNEKLQQKLAQEITEGRNNNYKNMLTSFSNSGGEIEIDEDESIADPYFAAIVNNKKEIVVNDSLYKITNEGLIFAHIKDSIHLYEYLENKQGDLKSHNDIAIAICDRRQAFGGVRRLDDKLSSYIRPIEVDDCHFAGGGGSGSGSGGGGTRPPSTPEEVRLNEIINNLSICSGSTNWFQGIFGKSYHCTDYFERKRRIKIEFWDQNWWIYKSVGIQARTQRRKFWIWWNSKSDEIHLGINKILLKYKYPEPDYSALDQFNNSLNHKPPIYMYKTKYYRVYGLNNIYPTRIRLENSRLPFFEFENRDILNIYIPKIPIVNIGGETFNFSTSDITSESNVKKLYEVGIDFLRSQDSSNNRKEFVVSRQMNNNEIEVLYFGERIKGTGTHVVKKRFYKDVAFAIGAAWNGVGNGNGSWSFEPVIITDAFRNYTHYELDFYGMARRGSTWRGKRMIR